MTQNEVSDKKREHEYIIENVIALNQKMGDVLENVRAPNGKMYSEILANGWGSFAQVKVDKETGDIREILRMETAEDKKFAKEYF